MIPEDGPEHRQGYLCRDFRVLYLRDCNGSHPDNHYHDFYKLLLLISGTGNYTVRGLSYRLQPGDIVLVGAHDAHMPDIPAGKPYERIVYFISDEFLRKYSSEHCDLHSIFSGVHGYVMRCDPMTIKKLQEMARISMSAAESADAVSTENYGASVLAHVELVRLLIQLGREQASSGGAPLRPVETLSGKVLRYIDEHFTEPLSIDLLAEHFFVSKYHLMRSFRQDVGTTIHSYLSDRRLLMARELIRNGESSTNACCSSGFGSYSAFARAYIAFFGTSPGKYNTKESDRPL